MRAESSRWIPSGITAAATIGAAAGAVAWFLASGWSQVVSGYIRLDQLTMMTLGAVAGATALGGEALRRREPIGTALIAGLIAGGVPALIVASVFASFSALGGTGFLVQRVVGWCCVVTATAVALAAARPMAIRSHLSETAGVAALGGAMCGLIVLLPGAVEFWLAIAFTAAGATIGIAVCGPALWRAVAIVEHAPPRNSIPRLLALREWSLAPGDVVALSTAQLSCANGRVALYPPAGGATVNGILKTGGIYLRTSSLIAVGGQRYLVQLRMEQT